MREVVASARMGRAGRPRSAVALGVGLALLLMGATSVHAQNSAPSPSFDDYTATQGQTLSVSTANGVLANDTDPDGDSLTASVASAPSNGDLTLDPDGSFEYTSDSSFASVESFSYEVSDGSATAEGVVEITVQEDTSSGGTNSAPVTETDSYTATQGQALSVSTANGVLANDTDPDGDSLSASVVSGVANGTLGLDGDGSFDYVSDSTFTGVDDFTYEAADGNGGTDQNVVEIFVEEDTSGSGDTNSAPVAETDSYTATQGQALSVSTANGVLANDTDPDGDSLSASVVSGPASGSLTLDPDGSFDYVSDSTFTGVDDFTYEAADGNGGTDQNIVEIFVEEDTTEGDTGVEPPVPAQLAASDTTNGVSLSWTAPDSASLETYNIYRDTAPIDSAAGPSGLSVRASVPATTTSYTDSMVTSGATHYYRVTAEDSAGTESGFSNEGQVRIDRESDDGLAVSVPLTVRTGAGNVQALTLGLDPEATNGLDSALGEVEQPPPPPAGVFDARLVNTDGGDTSLGEGVLTDVRPGAAEFEGTVVHALRVQSETDSSTIEWSLPADVTGVLEDASTGGGEVRVNMSGTGAATLATPEARRFTVTLQYGQTVRTPAVSVPVSVRTDAGNAQSLTAGLDPAATAGIDSSFGEEEQPPLPPAGVFDARWIDDDIVASGFGEGLLVDVRSGSTDVEGTRVHELQVQPGAEADSSTVSWALPADVTGTLEDVGSGGTEVSAAMADSGAVVLTDTSQTRRLRITLEYGRTDNAPPTAEPDSFSAQGGETLAVAAPGVLENDSDPDGDSLRVSLVSNVTDGTLTLESDGPFTYTPDPTFEGTDAFTYAVADGNGASAEARVEIQVEARTVVPTRVRATPEEEKIQLRWTAPTVGSVDGYYVYRDTSAFDSAAVPSDLMPYDSTESGTTTVTDTSVTPGTTYYYRVTAVGPDGAETAFSRTARGVPEGLVASVSQPVSSEEEEQDFEETGTELSFSGVSGSGNVTVDRYAGKPADTSGIKQKNVSSERVVIEADETLSFEGAEVRLAVSRFSGIENPAEVTVYKRDTPGEGPFQQLATRVGDNDTPDNPSDDTLYATTDSFSEFVLASDTQPLSDGDTVPLSPPESLTVDVSSNALNVSWADVSAGDLDGYRLYRDTAPIDSSAGPSGRTPQNSSLITESSYRDSDITAGTEYYYRVTAVDSTGNESAFSDELQVTAGDTDLGLVAAYPFDGSAEDASGNDNDGSVIGPTLTAGRGGSTENAYRFDGTDDYIAAAGGSVVGNLSVSLWVRTAALGDATLIEKPSDWRIGGADGSGESWLEGAGLEFRVSDDTSSYGAGYEMASTGGWRHVVGVHDADAGTLRLYVDGAPVDTQSVAGRTQSDSTLVIGADGTVSSGFFDGTIDDVRLYDRALSGGEVQALYRDGAPTPPPTLAVQDSVEQVALSWTSSGPSDVAEYAVYRDTTALDSTAGPGAYSPFATVPSANTAFVDTSVAKGQTYRYRVAAIDTAGQTSGFSPETSVTVAMNGRLAATAVDSSESSILDFRVEAVSADTTLVARTDDTGSVLLDGPSDTYAIGGETVRDTTYLSHDSTTTSATLTANDTASVTLDATTGYHLSLDSVRIGGQQDTIVAAPGDTVTLGAKYETWARTNLPTAVVYAVAGVDTAATGAVSFGTPGAAPGQSGILGLDLVVPEEEGAHRAYATYAAQTSEADAKAAYESAHPNPDRLIPVGTVVADGGAPSPPDTLVVSDSTGRVRLEWPEVSARDAQSYEIYRSGTPIDSSAGPSALTAIASVPAPDSAYVDTSVAIDSTYFYRITATDQLDQESGYSTESQVTVDKPARLTVAGKVRYYGTSSGVENVRLQLRGNATADTTTGSTGRFSLDLFARRNYTLTPVRSSDPAPAKGVTTADLAYIRRDVLHTDTLARYPRLAADADGSQRIATVDIPRLRRLIMGDATTLPGGLWRFVPANPDSAATAFDLPTRRRYRSPTSSQSDQGFVAVKRGDVDTTWANSTKNMPGGLKQKNLGPPVRLAVRDQQATLDSDTLSVPVRVEAFENVGGMQFTLEWDPKRLSLVQTGAYQLPGLSAESFGQMGEDAKGRATVVWNEPTGGGKTVTPGDSLFVLRYHAKTEGDAEIKVSSAVTPRFAHDGQSLEARPLRGETGTVTIEKIPDTFVMEPNYPNPVRQRTTIEYGLPEQAEVTMRLYDVLGRQVATLVHDTKDAGEYTTQVDASDLASGVYFYRFRAGDFTKTRRMVIVR